MLQTHHLHTKRPSKKLDNKKVKLFTITKRISEQAYWLKLPNTMHIHLVFHISLLKPFILNTIKGQVMKPSDLIKKITDKSLNKQEWEVKEILKS